MSWIWWLVGTLGIGGALVVVAGFVIGWPLLIGSRFGRTTIAIGLGVLALFGLYAKARLEGAASERARLKAIAAKDTANAKAENERIDNLSDDAVRSELSEWSRIN